MLGQTQLPRDSDGNHPKWAWPGGYPIYYMAADDSVVCASCANGSAYRTWNEDDLEHIIVAHGINWEDSALYCDDCNGRIESAYAEDEGFAGIALWDDDVENKTEGNLS